MPDKTTLGIVGVVAMFLGFLAFALIVYAKSNQSSAATATPKRLTAQRIRDAQKLMDQM